MFMRSSALALALLSAIPAGAQPRTDILTGEPVRPSRPEPEILNAPHAPRQEQGGSGRNPPMEIYVAPQIGTDMGYRNGGGAVQGRRPPPAPRRWEERP